MDYISVKAWARREGVAERTARNYCAQGKIAGAYLVGKTWSIPVEAVKPKLHAERSLSPLLAILREIGRAHV